jgi:acetyltransferase-like isoleucine patch superfamily enzyme
MPTFQALRSLLKSRKSSKPESVWTNRKEQYRTFNIGDWTYGEPTIRDWKQGSTLSIGRFCSLASGVTILLGGEHRTDWITTFPFAELMPAPPSAAKIGATKGDVTIGHDVWIGMDTFILSGVAIGCGAVVAARSVVTKPVKPYSIVAGNPARHIRYRIPEPAIPDMLSISWWNWRIDKILAASPLLLSNQIETFIATYRQGKEPLKGNGSDAVRPH